jgi:hypothetical protein
MKKKPRRLSIAVLEQIRDAKLAQYGMRQETAFSRVAPILVRLKEAERQALAAYFEANALDLLIERARAGNL